MIVRNVAINIRSIGSLKPTARSIHAQDAYHHNNMDRRLKNKSVHDRLEKRVVEQDWADYEEEGNERKYVWQKGQWCPGGLIRS